MKKNILSVLAWIALAIPMTGIAQVIPNAGFESWYNYSLGEYPTSWMTSDSVSVHYGGGNSAFPSSTVHSGSFALDLKSTLINPGIPIKGPGTATNGIITSVGLSFLFSGGSPDTARSRTLGGYYMYTPAIAGDRAHVDAYLLKRNGSSRDTIAAGSLDIADTVSVFTPFEVTLVYRDFINQPDTCLIILKSSYGALNDPTVGVGSEFIVDDLAFSGFVGIDEAQSIVNSVSLFPRPASSALHVEIDLKHATRLTAKIFDISGKLCLSTELESLRTTLDVSMLNNGTYYLNLFDENKSRIYSTSFPVLR